MRSRLRCGSSWLAVWLVCDRTVSSFELQIESEFNVVTSMTKELKELARRGGDFKSLTESGQFEKRSSDLRRFLRELLPPHRDWRVATGRCRSLWRVYRRSRDDVLFDLSFCLVEMCSYERVPEREME